VAEIPEHLLKRSRDRRAALGLGGDSADDAGSTQPATSSPARRGRAAAPAAPPPPKPDSPVVAAFKRRKRIPFWAMVALSLLPVWALLYARAVTTQAEVVAGPLGVGEEVYASTCAGCHAADGSGGAGYAFTEGEVLQTFPHIEDQLRWVYFGTEGYNAADVTIYGNPDRPGGAHITGTKGVMPAQGTALTGAELLSVVCHERYTAGGADAAGDYAEEFEQWCSEDSAIFIDLEGGGSILTLSDRIEGIIPIGPEPVPGLPPGEPAG
jgi:hypothetical protein